MKNMLASGISDDKGGLTKLDKDNRKIEELGVLWMFHI